MPVTVLIRNISIALFVATLLAGCGTPKLSKPSNRDKAEATKEDDSNTYKFALPSFPLLELIQPEKGKKQDAELASLEAQISLAVQAVAAGDSVLARELSDISKTDLGQLPVTRQLQWYQIQADLANIQGDLVRMLHYEQEILVRLPTHQRMKRNNLLFARLLEYNWIQIKQAQDKSQKNVFARGWFALTNMMASLPPVFSQQHLQWRRWRRQYAGHSADRFPPAQISAFFMVKPDSKPLALMLPLSGSYADFGKALQTGFNQVVAHPSNRSWRINTFDVVDQSSLQSALMQVTQRQMGKVIGPIDRNLAQQVWDDNRVRKQLALNFVGNTSSIHTRVQFGLRVEDEAQWIAKLLNANQNRRVAVLQQAGRNPIRAASRFTQKVKVQPRILPFSDNESLAVSIEEALGVTAWDIKIFKTKLAEYRKRQEEIIDPKELEILAEEDPVKQLREQVSIDILVVFADAEYAAQIKPLLHFYYAEDVKVIAYSAAFDLARQDENIDSDGLFIVDIPATGKTPAQWHEMVVTDFPINQQFFRFYAMGVDAALLAHNLERLIAAPGMGIRGATGRLSYNFGSRSILRDPDLFRIEGGKLLPANPDDLFAISCEFEDWKIEENGKNSLDGLEEQQTTQSRKQGSCI